MRSSPLWLIALLLVAACLRAGSAWGDDYPSRPIHIVVPARPGGNDIYARARSNLLRSWDSRSWLKSRRCRGRIAYEYVAKSKPDGYTLIIATSQSCCRN
jgi:tripartite-type tricarboxylate transporter receptor subunit TctC